MNVREAKQTARTWVDANLREWPGLRAAHLVGGITTMPGDAPFPASKDVDVHLIFAEGSPALEGEGPFANIIEASFGGVSIEAGVKSDVEYESAAAVLANPEIAYHLTVDIVLYDPSGLLRDLQEEVRREYPRRRWVCARLDHERRGLAGALAMLPMVREKWGASGEVNILGYTTTFTTAALWVATLNPPMGGSRTMLRRREALAALDRLDLHEELLAVLGLADLAPEQVEGFLQEAAEGFDLAVTLPRTRYPFVHKLHPHLRPYLVDSCRGMLDEGHHREAMGWVLPCHLVTTDVILDVGPELVKPKFAARQAGLLRTLGLNTAEARAAAVERATELYDQVFALADDIVASHREIVD